MRYVWRGPARWFPEARDVERDGEPAVVRRVLPGDVLDLTPAEETRYRRDVDLEPRQPEGDAAAHVDDGDEEDLPPMEHYKERGWPVRIRPETYIRIHPDGPHADLARKLVEGDDGSPDNPDES